MHLNELKALHVSQLLEMAAGLEIENANRLRKQELMFAIMKRRAKQGEQIFGDGVLEVLPDGFGFLRSPETSYLASTDDIYISPSQIRRFNLHTGDSIEGEVRVPVGEDDAPFAAVAPDGDLEPRRQGVGDRHPHPVQAAGKGVGAAVGLAELAPRVQAGEDQFDHGRVFLGVFAHRNAAAVVLDRQAAVGVQRDRDVAGVPGQRLVGGVVDDFLDDVQRIVGARVHPGPLAHGLQTLQDADRRFIVACGAQWFPSVCEIQKRPILRRINGMLIAIGPTRPSSGRFLSGPPSSLILASAHTT